MYPLDDNLVANAVVAIEFGVSDAGTGTSAAAAAAAAAASRNIADYKQHIMMIMMTVYSMNHFEIVVGIMFALVYYDDDKDADDDDDKHAE
jgi:hypothetical protein